MDKFYNRRFQVWEYRVSHGCLLIRSPKNNSYNYNIDIMFVGVDYLELPHHLTILKVERADFSVENEFVRELKKKLNRTLSKNIKLYDIISENTIKYKVLAVAVKVKKSTMDIFESPFNF